MHVARREGAFEGEMIFLAGRQRVEFQNFQPEQIGQVARVAGVGRDAVLVDEAGVEGADERAAVLDVEFQAVGFPGGKQMQRWRDDDFVLRQILGGPSEIHRDVAVVKRVVDELDVFAQAEKFVGLVGLLQRPVVVVAVKDADFRDDFRVLQRGREHFEFFTDLADFLIDPAGAFKVMRQNGAVELFGAESRLAPSEKNNRRGTARNQLVSEHPQYARTHQ